MYSYFVKNMHFFHIIWLIFFSLFKFAWTIFIFQLFTSYYSQNFTSEDTKYGNFLSSLSVLPDHITDPKTGNRLVKFCNYRQALCSGSVPRSASRRASPGRRSPRVRPISSRSGNSSGSWDTISQGMITILQGCQVKMTKNCHFLKILLNKLMPKNRQTPKFRAIIAFLTLSITG